MSSVYCKAEIVVYRGNEKRKLELENSLASDETGYLIIDGERYSFDKAELKEALQRVS